MSYRDARETIHTVVTYLRVSTDAQVEKFSLPAQDKLTREVADKYGWEIAKVYRDEGFSGAWIEKRPAFSALLKEAARRAFDAVLVTDFDRLTRPDNLRDLGRIQEVFIAHDIKIVTLSDVIDLSNDDQWFLSSLLGIVGAKEKKKLVARVKRGIQAKKETGAFYGGIPPAGYQWDGQGNLALRELTEAFVGKKGKPYTCYDWRTVRAFFDLYLYQGTSMKAICRRYGVYHQTLSDILDRAWFYAGYVLQTRSKAEWASSSREPRDKLVAGRHPRIITPEEAKKVLEKRKDVRVAYTNTRLKFPCVGLLRCGVCGHSMYVYKSVKYPKRGPQTYFYYVCKTRHGGQKWIARQKGIELESCGMPFVRAEVVEEAAWRAMETFLVSPEVVFEQVGDAGQQVSRLEREMRDLEREKSALGRRQSRLLDLYERAEAGMLEELDARLDRMKKAQETLRQRQLECQERMVYYRQQQVDPDQVYRILGQIEEIVRFAAPEHRLEIFRSLFCEMIVRSDQTLEVSATLPTEGVVRRLAVALDGSGEGGEKVYLNAQQESSIVEHCRVGRAVTLTRPLTRSGLGDFHHPALPLTWLVASRPKSGL